MPFGLLLRPTVLLSIALALALGLAGVFYKLHTHDLVTIGRLTAERDAILEDAKACSDATERLRAESAKKAAEVRAALAVASGLRKKLDRAADTTLLEKPTVPSDTCASALALSRRKLEERRIPR